MAVSDLIVIYLSLGAPFGAHSLVTSTRQTGEFRIIASLSSFVFWPAYAAVKAVPILFPRRSRQLTADRSGADRFEPDGVRSAVSQIKAGLFGSDRAAAARFLAAMERYVELGIFLRSHEPSGGSRELFEIAGHPSPEMAARCAERRNLRTVTRHHTMARADVMRLNKDLAFDELRSPMLRSIASELGDEVLGAADTNSTGIRACGSMPTDHMEQLQWAEQNVIAPKPPTTPLASNISTASLRD